MSDKSQNESENLTTCTQQAKIITNHNVNSSDEKELRKTYANNHKKELSKALRENLARRKKIAKSP